MIKKLNLFSDIIVLVFSVVFFFPINVNGEQFHFKKFSIQCSVVIKTVYSSIEIGFFHIER